MKRLRRRQPLEADALFLGVRHFPARARHVAAVPAVEAAHRGSPLPHRGAYAVHRRVAAANHHDIAARRVENAAVKRLDRIAEALAVGGDQIVERLHDPLLAGSRSAQIARLVHAAGQQHGVVPLPKLAQRNVAADIAAQVEGDAALLDLANPPQHGPLVQLEVGDAVDEKAAGAVVPVVDGDLIAPSTQPVGSRQARWSRADNAHRFGALRRRRDGGYPSLLPGALGDVPLHRADGDGAVPGLLDDAVALAKAVLRADAAADFREGVGRLAQLVSLIEAALGGQLQPVGDVVVERTVSLAGRHAALRTARSLLRGQPGCILAVDLVEVVAALLGNALFRHCSGQIDEG